MRVHVLEREQVVPRDPEEVSAFFSDAHNLEAITPPFLGFEVLTPQPVEMRAGAFIECHRLPRGPLGALGLTLVDHDLRRIFDFRAAEVARRLSPRRAR